MKVMLSHFIMNNNLKKIVMENDNHLYNLAMYAETRGLCVNANSENVLKRFAEYKNLIKRGSVTLEKLEVDIYNKFGITEGTQYHSVPCESLPQDIKDMIEELDIGEQEEV